MIIAVITIVTKFYIHYFSLSTKRVQMLQSFFPSFSIHKKEAFSKAKYTYYSPACIPQKQTNNAQKKETKRSHEK